MNIFEIINKEQITIKYQPIMSSHNEAFIGVEALVRGCDGIETIPPNILFNEASSNDCTLELDKLCIKKALLGFSHFHKKHSNVVLFINIDSTVIKYYIENNYIYNITNEASIAPQNIVLEINELHSDSLINMKNFSRKYSALGYLIALDDVGAGSSNLDRIPIIMPNIMKIDRDLIHGIHHSYYKTQVVSMVIQLAINIGALIVIEGLETIEELKKTSEFGAHLIQGFYLGKPRDLSNDFITNTSSRIKEIIDELHRGSIRRSNQSKSINQQMKTVALEFISLLHSEHESNYQHIITFHIGAYNVIQSVYVINFDGVLVTDTTFSPQIKSKKSTTLYTPCKLGDSVQLQNYYTNIVYGGYDFWISNEYISRATGIKCCTLSYKFNNQSNDQYILCIDFWKNSIKKTPKSIEEGA